MNQETYNQLPGLNNSGMKWLEKSPAHYKAWRDGLFEQSSPALTLGIAIHCAILEPARFASEYLALPDTSHLATPGKKAAATKAAKKEYADSGKSLLSHQDYNTVTRIWEAVMAHPYARYLVEESEPEVVHQWTDEDSGALCKGRTDLIMPKQGIISDIKSAEDASPEGFSMSIARYQLHRQAAFYRDGCKAQQFNFIVVEKVPPYGVMVYNVPDYVIDIGRKLYKPLSHLYQRCLDSNEWPSYSQDVTSVNLPAWAIPDAA